MDKWSDVIISSENSILGHVFRQLSKKALGHSLMYYEFSDGGCTKSSFEKRRSLILIFPQKDIGPGVSEKPFGMTIADFCFSIFFQQFQCFSNFCEKQIIGPEASEKHFGSSGKVREGIWGRPGEVREASREVLGLSGGVRGASWEGLWRSWGDLGATFGAV